MKNRPSQSLRRITLAAAAGILAATTALSGIGHAENRRTPPPAAPGKEELPPVTPEERRELLDQLSLATGIPWYRLAAADQFHRVTRAGKKGAPEGSGRYPQAEWAGPLNPNPEDMSPTRIGIFGGKGRDGSGDGQADRRNDLDTLLAFVQDMSAANGGAAQWEASLRRTFGERGMTRIDQFAKIYEAFGRLDLQEHAFPVPLKSEYTFRSTWGASRGWGGNRIHEGTDIFAGYGVPARSTCYGIIEVKGWNNYGGWRIGIRDLNNVYHYYAHLSGFSKEVEVGTPVRPGQVVGWVGSSGYGKPGTSGKFPPHLHYGLYKDTGKAEWAFDPYPSLLRWEREERARSKAKP
ncbi:M23 family metallopeptidase [Gorillibacterium timonense]|uniref:M23 family metallopeptidase n=1 Tax=Gorillibacterium timonense TaxID=1689269 RepID=UPI00071C32C1|nr:M23 family metallopeptidase [Gorillibacterium timonense]